MVVITSIIPRRRREESLAKLLAELLQVSIQKSAECCIALAKRWFSGCSFWILNAGF